MSKGAIVCLLMLLNVNTYANVVLEGFFRAVNEVYFGVHLNETTIDTNEWIYVYNAGYEMEAKQDLSRTGITSNLE